MSITIGFVGLGRMGRGIAKRLARSAHDLVVFDREDAAMAEIVAEGARAARDVAELSAASTVIFTSLPGPVQVEDVVLGAGGIASTMRRGTVVFDLSTNALATVRRVEQEIAARGAHFLDAPISGGPAGAASGDLALWIGGDAAVYEEHRALLELVGDKAIHVGGVGSGTVTKLVHNLMGYSIMQVLAENFSVAVKAGMDPLDLWSALRLGAVGKVSPLDLLTRQFLPGRYTPPAFLLELAHKDVTLATQMARDLRVPLRIGDQTMAEMTEALGRGLGDSDSRAFLTLQLERAGVEIAVDPDRLADAIASSNGR